MLVVNRSSDEESCLDMKRKKKKKEKKKKKLRTYNILCSCEAESENDRIEGRPQTLLIDMALTDCHGFHGLI